MKLVNSSFTIEYDGSSYEVKKANLAKVAEFQSRAKKYIAEGEGGYEAKLVAYAFWLILKDKVEGLTEEKVLETLPGDLDYANCLQTLGFLKAAKEPATPESPTTDSSS